MRRGGGGATLPGVLAIEAHELRKRYTGLFGRGGTEALRGLQLGVERGSAFGLIGLNGAGKTTFIKTLLGVVRPTSGVVRVLGGDPDDVQVRARIGYLPERLHLPGALTPIEFLRGVGRLKRLPDPLAEARVQLGRVGLSSVAGRKLAGFSKGMKQRTGLAAALLGAPELLVLDEPTDGVDPLGRVEIRAILAEERARGATLFLNSHLLSETERICDRIGVLAGGVLVREGSLEALTQAQDRWTVRFAGAPDEAALLAAGFTRVGDRFETQAEDAAALNARLDAARATGALLVGLERGARDLEEVLRGAIEPGSPS